MKSSRPLLFGVLIVIVVFVLCCVCALGIAGVSLYFSIQESSSRPNIAAPTVEEPVPTASQPTPEAVIVTQEPVQTTLTAPNTPIIPSPVPVSGTDTETLLTLETTIVPINDPIALAERLEDKENLPVNLEFPVKTYQVGDRETFWVTDSDTNENSEVPATLRFVTDHVYFWIEDGVTFNERQLEALVETFEDEIYPTNREFFGSEWTPGVDADPHLYILYAGGLGGSVAGYFSTADEYLPVVREYSNGHEMFLLSVDHVDLDEEFAYSVLAHEFQHMIHWYRDRNEETWMNEGASDLASFLNGYSIGGHDRIFAADPDIQLTDWPNNATSNTEHYGAAFLFMTYFLDRFGEDATKALVADPANGMVSIDDVLAALDLKDPLDGELVTADDVFTDWLIANFLQDEQVSDGRYTYHNYPAAPEFSPTESIDDCPLDLTPQSVHQYGVNYIRIRCEGDYVLHFEGSTQINVLPENPFSGSYAFYSNRGDESDMTLTRTFDFSDTSGPLTLTYWTWYDLEEDYDYLYLTASTNGEDWQILTTPSGTAEDPSGNSYGWGYNGVSGGGPSWIEEKIDISQFAGQEVQLRFEYVTDAAVNGEGLLVDDISIPETDYFTDFEEDDGGWEADGFVRIQNQLPQSFRLALISTGQETTVEMIPLSGDNIADIPIKIGDGTREIILVVTGTSRYTRQTASYSFSIQPR
jgi:hypothetical protein